MCLSQFYHCLYSPPVHPFKDKGKVVSDLVWDTQSEGLGPVSPWKSLPLCLSYRTLIGRPPILGIRLLTPSISLTVLPIPIWLGWSVVLSRPYGYTHLQRNTEFQDEKSQILFVLSYMKGGTAGPWAMQKINAILSDADSAPETFDNFTAELDVMFADPN